MTTEDPIVLLVDDSVNDATLLRAAFERVGFAEPLRTAADADMAMSYLRGDGVYRNRLKYPLPAALLVDLNMPGKNGFELLAWIRQQPALKDLRVFILSASSQPQDIERAYHLGANSYLVKPRNFDGLIDLAKSLLGWLKLSHFSPATVQGDDHGFAPANSALVGAGYSSLHAIH